MSSRKSGNVKASKAESVPLRFCTLCLEADKATTSTRRSHGVPGAFIREGGAPGTPTTAGNPDNGCGVRTNIAHILHRRRRQRLTDPATNIGKPMLAKPEGPSTCVQLKRCIPWLEATDDPSLPMSNPSSAQACAVASTTFLRRERQPISSSVTVRPRKFP